MRTARSAWRAQRSVGSFGVVVALVVLVGSGPLYAQVAGTISGYVQDQGGGAMPGATVTAESAGQQLVRSTTTNATGFFDLQALPRGTYVIKVEMTGFETQVQKDVELTAGANVRLDFALKVGGLAEQVEVSGRTTMVETRNATQSNLIDDQRVQDLPMNGRNVVALAGTYAGVTSIRANQDTSDGRQGPIMSVNGGNTESQPVHAERLGVHALQPDDRLQPAAARRDPGDPDSDAQLLGRVRAHRGQPGEHRLEGGHERLPRNRVGVPPQLRAEHPQLLLKLPDAETGAAAESGGRQRRRRHHPEQAVLVRLLSAALGSERGRFESDDRADRCAARRRLHRAQHAT